MSTNDPLPPLRDVIQQHGLSAKKSLGQNFILDLNLTRRIARAGGPLEGITVIEVGPGPGGLTRALLMEGAKQVIAIERDDRCFPALLQISDSYPGRLRIVQGDALEIELRDLAPEGFRVIANLPYGIATELLIKWLTPDIWPPAFDRLVLMFQREVAERIVAAPGSRTYGRLSVLTQWRTRPRILFNLPPQAFTPPPKIESSVVEFSPLPDPLPAGSVDALQQVTAAAFGQRRKMLRQSLKSILQDTEKKLEMMKIDPTARAETLSVSDFCILARACHENTVETET